MQGRGSREDEALQRRRDILEELWKYTALLDRPGHHMHDKSNMRAAEGRRVSAANDFSSARYLRLLAEPLLIVFTLQAVAVLGAFRVTDELSI